LIGESLGKLLLVDRSLLDQEFADAFARHAPSVAKTSLENQTRNNR
jgi:hypothetical protein